MWAIWLGQNSLIFTGKSIPYHSLKQNSISHAIEFFFLSTVPLSHSPLSSVLYIRWSPTPFPFITLNTNESSLGNPSRSGAGGVARSATGEWLWGLALHLGVTNNTMTELWGIREALVRVWTNGYYRGCLQTDSLLVYKWLTTNEDYPMEFSNLMLDCRWLLSKDWEVHIEHK